MLFFPFNSLEFATNGKVIGGKKKKINKILQLKKEISSNIDKKK